MYPETSFPYCPWPSHTPKKCSAGCPPSRLGAKMNASWFCLNGLFGMYPILVAKANFVTIFLASPKKDFIIYVLYAVF